MSMSISLSKILFNGHSSRVQLQKNVVEHRLMNFADFCFYQGGYRLLYLHCEAWKMPEYDCRDWWRGGILDGLGMLVLLDELKSHDFHTVVWGYQYTVHFLQESKSTTEGRCLVLFHYFLLNVSLTKFILGYKELQSVISPFQDICISEEERL